MQAQRPHHMLGSMWSNLREASTGGEFLSALTLLGLAIAQITLARTNTSLLVLLLGEKFPRWVVFMLVILAVVHFVCLALPKTHPVIAVRKVLSFGGMVIWSSLVYDLVKGGQTGGTLVFGGVTVFLLIAVWRVRY